MWSWFPPAMIIFAVTLSVMAMRWSRSRFGGRRDDDGMATDRAIALLAEENGRLGDRIVRLEERIAVLERIATDAPARLAREIEALR